MRYLLCIVLIVVLGIGTYSCSRSRTTEKSQQNAPQIIKAERGPLRVIIESNGTIEPEREVEIKCEASGEITKLPVDVSDVVKKGDLLVQLDPRDAEILVKRAQVEAIISKAKLKQAKVSLEVAQQEIENSRRRSKATLASAEVLSKETTSQLKRIVQLHEQKIISEQSMESAQTTQAKAIADLEAAKISLRDIDTQELHINSLQQAIDIAEQDVVTSEIDLEDAQERLSETTVQSPINGVVTTRDVQVGQIISSGTSNVGGGTTVLYLADISSMYVLVSVDESDIGRISKKQDVLITVDAFPEKEFKGSVVRVASKGVSSSDVVTFEVKVEVNDQEKTLLKPGMTANVEILIVAKKDILRVPSEVVQQSGQGCFVTICNANDTTSKRKVVIGETDGDWIEILDGLLEGDQLVATQQNQSQWRSGEESSTLSISNNLLGMGSGEGPSGGSGGPGAPGGSGGPPQ